MEPYPISSGRESGKTGVNWRDSRAFYNTFSETVLRVGVRRLSFREGWLGGREDAGAEYVVRPVSAHESRADPRAKSRIRSPHRSIPFL